MKNLLSACTLLGLLAGGYAHAAGQAIDRYVRASQLIGEKVVNTRGERLGEIEELAINMYGGQVAYAVLSMENVESGFRDRRYGVPIPVLKLHADNLVLDVAQETLLAAAPGNGAGDARYVEEIERHYGKSRGLPDSPYGNRLDSPEDLQRSQNYRAFRARELLDTEIRDRAGNVIGRLEDLVVDMTDGDVAYAVVSISADGQLGNRLYPVALSALSLPWDFGPYRDHLALDRTAVKTAGDGFDRRRWPSLDSLAERLGSQ